MGRLGTDSELPEGYILESSVERSARSALSEGRSKPTQTEPLLSVRSLPVLLAYVAFPTIQMLTRLAGQECSRTWLDICWLLFAIAAISRLAFRPFHPLTLPVLPRTCWIIAPLVAYSAVQAILLQNIVYEPYFMELKPVAYAVCCSLWVTAFGFPSKIAFVKPGLILGGLIVMECLVGSLLEHQLVHPLGSGETNYDAFLILLSLCAELSRKPERKRTATLLFIAIAITMSRTGIIAALAVLFVSGSTSYLQKAIALGVGAGASALSFIVRGLGLDLGQVDRVLMWGVGVDILHSNPASLIFGFGPGKPLPVTIPPELLDLWNYQTERISVPGTFAFQFHAMWLRMLISYGSIPVAITALGLLVWLIQRRSALARLLSSVILLEAFTMGGFYLSNIGVPLFLITYIAALEVRNTRRSRRVGAPLPKLDPVQRKSMRRIVTARPNAIAVTL